MRAFPLLAESVSLCWPCDFVFLSSVLGLLQLLLLQALLDLPVGSLLFEHAPLLLQLLVLSLQVLLHLLVTPLKLQGVMGGGRQDGVSNRSSTWSNSTPAANGSTFSKNQKKQLQQ